MERELIRGNLNLLILTLLHGGPLYGLQIAKQLGMLVDDAESRISYGSVYPALHRLEQQALIQGTSLPSAEGARPVRQYSLTPAGSAELTRLQTAQLDFIRQLKALWGES